MAWSRWSTARRWPTAASRSIWTRWQRSARPTTRSTTTIRSRRCSRTRSPAPTSSCSTSATCSIRAAWTGPRRRWPARCRAPSRSSGSRGGKVDVPALLGLGVGTEDDIENRKTHHDDELDHDHDEFDSFVVPLPEIADPDQLVEARVGHRRGRGRAARSRVSPRCAASRCGSWCRRSGRASPRTTTAPGRRRKSAQTRLVVIGLKGLDRDHDRAHAQRMTDASALDQLDQPRRYRRAGRSRSAAGRYRYPFVRRQRSGRACGRVGGRARCAAERAARAAARSQASDVGRSVDRARRLPRQGDRGSPARRHRLVALRRRPALGAGPRARHRARGAAGRGPRRSAARRRLDAAAGRARGTACAISARAGATISARCCAGWRGMPGAAVDCTEPRTVPRTGGYTPAGQAVDLDRPDRRAAEGQAGHPDRVLSLDAARRRRRADRRAVRGAGRARPGAGAAVRHQPQGRGVGSLPARGDAAACAGIDRHHDGLCRGRRRRRLDPARRGRRAGAAGRRRHHQARRLGREPARSRRRRPRHACRAARARRPRARRRDRVQESVERRSTVWPSPA